MWKIEFDKKIKKEETLEKHLQAAYEDISLFCHYFNNEKDWPFEEECIFIHEESELCKFGKTCERILCMYRHERGINEDDDDSESENESDSEDELGDVDLEELIPV